ncbi:hypothetical protein ABXZ88_003256 [Vibrio fluvialis]|uniref:hypothetical protein n=1 Tax=Vibrio fluvialis TaxID=676 RepID=UPI0023A9E263|nr:hypothetical protein [Vibrio fluvialis]MDE5179134.1 hypothetical protein [Vibrio fluvialis]
MPRDEPAFGELIELYTNTAVIQAQRIPVMKKDRQLHLVNITIAPLVDRVANFDQKITLQLGESAMAYVAAGLMGLKKNLKVDGTRAPNATEAKVLYLNNNDDETTNISLSSLKGQQQKMTRSITFKYQERYPLLRIIASQLTKNSVGYEQTIADTLNLIRGSYMK